MNWRYPLAQVSIGDEEKTAVQQVLESGWLTMGEVTQEFEAAFASYLSVPHAIAVSNGTTALHLACRAINLKAGDEVILPALTFVATAAAVLYTGATPVFADIVSDQNLTLSAEAIEQHITNRTRAIIVMHYGGYACDMPSICDLAWRKGLWVIEDAAHAPGSELEQTKLGAWGDIACFSFFSNKNMTTGEGGMVVTRNDGFARRMRMLRSHGMTTMTWDRHRGHAWSYDVMEMGYNYRTDEIHSAIGLAQLKKLEAANARRQKLTGCYRDLLARRAPEITVPFLGHRGVSACHLMPVLLPPGSNRTRFMEFLKSQGIQSSIHYPPIHHFHFYKRHHASSLPVTEDVAEREVTLPLYPELELADIDAIVSAIRQACRELK